jgi:hypothetical protein
MKKQTAYRLTRNDLQKLEGNGKAQKNRNVRRMGKVLIGCTVIGTLGVLVGLSNFETETTPAPVAAPAPTVTAPVSLSGEQQAFCKKHGVLVENCANVYELVRSGQPVEGINYFDNDERESYGEYLAKQNQRKADLAYCAKNRGDWSCSEGQYRGQY